MTLPADVQCDLREVLGDHLHAASVPVGTRCLCGWEGRSIVDHKLDVIVSVFEDRPDVSWRQVAEAAMNKMAYHEIRVDKLTEEYVGYVEAWGARAHRAEAALAALVDDEPCTLDHDGFCQTHYFEPVCPMEVARSLLGALGGEPTCADLSSPQ